MKWEKSNEETPKEILVTGNSRGFTITKKKENICTFLSRQGFIAKGFKYPNEVLNHIARCIHASDDDILYVDSTGLTLIEEINEANRDLY